MNVYKDPPPGMCVCPDKDNLALVSFPLRLPGRPVKLPDTKIWRMTRRHVTRLRGTSCDKMAKEEETIYFYSINDTSWENPIFEIHALITGPFDTPYEGGFFYFIIRCPPTYPFHAPRVKFMTTGEGRVRFNPNLYKNGKVCLSILGTWSGPDWSPAGTISSLLISIQSLLNERPYHNEPGYEQERNPGDVERYNNIIKHETMRVAVCDMLEMRCQCPEPLREVMEQSFPDYYDYYESTCRSQMHLNRSTMVDPFGEKRGKFDYQSILNRLKLLKDKFSESQAVDSDQLEDADES